MSQGPLEVYRQAVRDGKIKPDPAQSLAVEKLQSLHMALAGYRPGQGLGGWKSRFGLSPKKSPGLNWRHSDAVDIEPKQGLYMFGQVGRGKSMLMDLFFHAATIPAKKRIHFHEFMRDIHGEMHSWRQAAHRGQADPIPKLARSIASEAWLLCLDELQVTDIGDAMIVGRLFEALLDEGVVMVITSNRPPHDLYKDGLQRERFLPFIELIENRLDLLQLDARADYRLGRTQGIQVFHAPLGPQATTELDQAFLRLSDGEPAAPDHVDINGRQIVVPRATASVARFHFTDLCSHALGASDYLAIAARYPAIIIDGIPTLTPERRDEAKRFVTLVDAMYEAKTLFLCSAEASAETLYPEGIGAFEFQRTVSRLMEMQSESYIQSLHGTANVGFAATAG